MRRRVHSALMLGGLALAACLGSCGGEITTVSLGAQREASFERFRDEVQPVLQAPTTPEDAAAGVLLRDCTSAAGCHGANNGAGGLRLVADPDEAEIIENFRQATSRIDLGSPAESLLLTDPLTVTPHFPQSFIDENDCCYQIVLAWIEDSPSPGCTCPPGG